MLIRQVTPADLAQLEEVESAADTLFIERFKPSYWAPPPGLDERLAHGGDILVIAEDTNSSDSTDASTYRTETVPHAGTLSTRVAGFMHVLFPTQVHAHVEALSVRPELGRRGYGAALVKAGVQLAKERGMKWITLRTYADVPWNEGFYRRCGFEVWEVDSEVEERRGGIGCEVGRESRGQHQGEDEDAAKTWLEFNDSCMRAEEGMGLMEYGRRIVMRMRLAG